MKKKLFAAIATVLIVVCVCATFSACSDKTDVSEIIAALESENIRAAQCDNMTSLQGYEIVDYVTGGENVIFYNASGVGDYIVYNSEKAGTIYGGYNRPYIFRTNGGTVWGDVYFVVNSSYMGEQVSFYTADGVIVENVSSDGLLVYISSDVYEINSEKYSAGSLDIGNGQRIVKAGDVYYVEGATGGAVLPYNAGETIELDNYKIYEYRKNNDGAYAFVVIEKDKYTGGKTVSVSDITGHVSSGSGYTQIIPLSGDCIAVQEIVRMPLFTTKGYDFYMDDAEYCINTYVYDVVKDKTKQIKNFDYFISSSEYIENSGLTVCHARVINEDKTLSDDILQIFDSSLKVAVDVQKILPGANSMEAGYGCVIFSDGLRTVICDNSGVILDAPSAKINTESYLATSGIMLSADGKTVYGADGSKMISLDDVGGTAFMYLDYAQNYIYYKKVENYSNSTISEIYAYSRSSGTSQKIGYYEDVREVASGLILAKNHYGSYDLYDLVTFNSLVSFGNDVANIYYLADGYLFVSSASYYGGTQNTYLFVKR